VAEEKLGVIKNTVKRPGRNLLKVDQSQSGDVLNTYCDDLQKSVFLWYA